MDAESLRLAEDALRERNWKRWGPYLSERQWGTVREDYSASGNCWEYFPHDHARSRAYRWGEDGLLGITDRECRLCFSLSLWNGHDPILKERLFGLTNGEGNHGEDVKECYYYLDATPTASYLKALYKYPQAAFPYAWLVEENRRRGKFDPEFELADTGVFNESRYFDVLVEYAKQSTDDILIRITASNRGPEAATLHLLPTLWFRNTWSWGCKHEGCWPKPRLHQSGDGLITADHITLKRVHLWASPDAAGKSPPLLFTENETNHARVFGFAADAKYMKDAFDDYVIHGRHEAVNPKLHGTKSAAHYVCDIPAGESAVLRLRLAADQTAAHQQGDDQIVEGNGQAVDVVNLALRPAEFDQVFADRRQEADKFYEDRIPVELKPQHREVARQGYAGLLWSKQFYEYIVKDWLEGDPEQPTPPAAAAHRPQQRLDAAP